MNFEKLNPAAENKNDYERLSNDYHHIFRTILKLLTFS